MSCSGKRSTRLERHRERYVIEEKGETERYGFAYGTLRDHAERGEERFSVELRRGDETVWYEVLAFSRPSPLISPTYPLARMLQRRFAQDSRRAMKRETSEANC